MIEPANAELEPAQTPVPPRRRAIQLILGGGLLASVASFLYPVFRFLIPPPEADLGSDSVVAAKTGELKPNSARIFRFKNKPALLLRTSNGEYKAISATCTHLSCTVQYRADRHDIWCACHNGVYDTNGRNVSGPPPRPLEVFDVHTSGDDIVVASKQST